MKHPLGAVVAVTLWATGSALAAGRAITPAYAAQELSGKQIRASIVSARGQRADRRTTLAVTTTLRDNQVLESLGWKEQLSAAKQPRRRALAVDDQRILWAVAPPYGNAT